VSRRLTVLTATVLVFLGVAGFFLLAGGSWGRGGDGGGSLFGPKVAVVELEGSSPRPTPRARAAPAP